MEFRIKVGDMKEIFQMKNLMNIMLVVEA